MTVADLASFELQGLPDRSSFLDSALVFLSRLFPSDAIAWNSVDISAARVEVRGTPPEVYNDPIWARRMEQFNGDNPMVVSYLGVSSQKRALPRRLTDVASESELRCTQAYGEVLHPLGIERQLTILTGRPAQQAGRCWAFVRSGSDYTDDDVALATQLQPMLRLLDTCFDEPTLNLTPESADRFKLSNREVQVLQHLAEGHTAVAIGRLLRISPGTVRKHLQHLYDKLGAHDRLQAVSVARKYRVIA